MSALRNRSSAVPSWPIAMPALDVHTNGSGRPGRSIGAAGAQDVARHDRGGLDTADPRDHDDELVATETGQDRAGRGGVLEADGDLAQQRVADLVPEGVVDELEPVEVQQHEGHGVLRRRPIEGLGEADVEHGPVGQPGEGVALGEADEFTGRLLPRGDVQTRPWTTLVLVVDSGTLIPRKVRSVPSAEVTRNG